jgi:arylformamidase
MAAQGVRLFGTDCPSVDPLDSKDLLAHKAFGRSGIYILEGLALADIAPGPYELIALPLNLIGADAAPVRAILRGGRR